MQARRILLVSNESTVVGGGEISMLLMLKGLLESDYCDPILAVPGDGEVADRAREFGVEVVELTLPRLKRQPWRIHRAVQKAGDVIASVGPDLLHANGSRAMLIAGRAAKKAGLPVIWHVRVEGSDWLDPFLERRSDNIIVPSRTVSKRFSPDKVRIVPNPVPLIDADHDHEAVRQLRATFANEDEFILLTVGEVSPHKGYSRILEALARLEVRRPWHLLVVGKENQLHLGYSQQLQKDALKAGLADRMHLLGFRNDVDQLMLASDLLIHAPDLEGFGRVFIEAMALGLPVVSTPIGGLAELHEETGYGWLAKDLDPGSLTRVIEEALEDENARQAFSNDGPKIARSKYSLGAHTRSVVDVYREILGAEE